MRIYLDHNASTPLEPRAAAAMQALLMSGFGNPSSGHWAGRPAREAVEHSRGQVAAMLGADPTEIVFTSGGSEANNFAIKGAFFSARGQGAHIVTSAVEHPAVIEPCRFVESLGASVTYLPVDRGGRIDPADFERAIGPRTILATIMHANNEVGTVQPIAECAAIARRRGVPFHTDAAQSVGKIATRVDQLGVDLLTIAAHKFGGPKGVGALYVRSGTALTPLIQGAGHESGRRAGTESALLAAGLGEAAAAAIDLSPMAGVEALRDRLWNALSAAFGERVARNGDPDHCLPNTLNIAFPGQIGAAILARLDGVAASTGSACHAGRVELSATLAAMGVPAKVGMGAIRFSLGRSTRIEEIDRVVGLLVRALG